MRRREPISALPCGTPPPATPAALLNLLEQAGGVMQVIDPPEDVRAAWRSLLHVVRRDGHVPEGWHLLHRGRNVGDLVIELRPGEHPARRYRPSATGSIAVPWSTSTRSWCRTSWPTTTGPPR